VKKEMADKLVVALRFGEYTQGRIVLEGEGKMCCLGVACALIRDELPHVYADNKVFYIDIHGSKNSRTLPEKARVAYGFATEQGSRVDGGYLLIGDWKAISLAEANDSGATFTEIADYIEANWEYL
jgi:hypothetical protein